MQTANYTESKDNCSLTCSNCGNKLRDEQMYISKNYCPNCGCKILKTHKWDVVNECYYDSVT